MPRNHFQNRQYYGNYGESMQPIMNGLPEIYESNFSITMESIINDIINNKMALSGRLIKIIFDEYQKGINNQNDFTIFYTNYVLGNKKTGHISISDTNVYTLVFNKWNELIPVKLFKGSDVDNILRNIASLQNPEQDQNNKDPEFEKYARRVALDIYNATESDPLNWESEIENGCHNWNGDIHSYWLGKAKNILTGKGDN